LIHFDLDERYVDEQIVGSAISRREGVVMSVVLHAGFLLTLLFAPALPMFRTSPEELQRLEQLRLEEARRQNEQKTFVFVQPKVDVQARRAPDRAEMSDKDREARTRERAPNPTNTMPFSRGNSTQRVETSELSRPRDPESPSPEPTPGEAVQPQASSDIATRQLPPAQDGLTLPRPESQQARAGSGALGEALKNLQKYVQKESFNNPNGGDGGQFGPFIQFDTKGVEFGPWIRRFVAQVKRNWFIPMAAMTMRGHVVLQFNVHKDGRISDVNVVGPSDIDAFNNAAKNAIVTSNPTEPLPPEYPTEAAFFTVTFFYNEEPPH
jgi:TonB family protein